jgi:hypothetical protein
MPRCMHTDREVEKFCLFRFFVYGNAFGSFVPAEFARLGIVDKSETPGFPRS